VPVIVVALITVRRAELAQFRAYEAFAIARARAHGGALERCVEIDLPDPDLARELHLLRFPDAAAFARFRADPALTARHAERAAVVVAAEVWIGVDGPAY
jgi:hypothetical protein